MHPNKSFHLAQLSDTHICTPGTKLFNGVDSATKLQAAISSILSLKPPMDATLISGDLCQHGHIEEYRHLRLLLEPLSKQMPVYLALGNHDHHEHFMEVFHDYPGINVSTSVGVQYRIPLLTHQLIVLDSLVEGEDYGVLSIERLEWLDHCLAKHPEPAILVIHHPMISTGNTLMDSMHLISASELEQVCIRHRHIRAILCGHIHRTIFGHFANIPVVVGPSCAHSYPMHLTLENASQLCHEPTGFLVHLDLPTREWVTHSLFS